ncbi:hypothetical protein FAIPA1_10190 [Frankia sp. AiPs1]|uniref:hypothetical protein n=1 Tax=Frankia sp. AiPa1 TaxID=573492 RepID=UPI00202B4BCD|nr:hypothetical protein [Frankia sp. AiPa1]MCL9759821.1 hypothetical protein [Frankia sp. AiPa1]
MDDLGAALIRFPQRLIGAPPPAPHLASESETAGPSDRLRRDEDLTGQEAGPGCHSLVPIGFVSVSSACLAGDRP